MTLDIRNGDTLVDANGSATLEFPIIGVSLYETDDLNNTATFAAIAVNTYSTKRAPAMSVGGKRGNRATNLTNLSGTPVDPISPENRGTMSLQSIHDLAECYIADADGYARLILERPRKDA